MKHVVIITNHSFMLYKFRHELIEKLLETCRVTLLMPKGDCVDKFIELGCDFTEVYVDRRGINPAVDLKLMKAYKRLLCELHPDLVVTYSIKPNIYAGLVCSKLEIPYAANVQGLGTAFQGGLLTMLVTVMYRTALRRANVIFFENRGNMDTFVERRIIDADKACLLNGAGVNLDTYYFCKYPENDDEIHFLYVGRIMREKGMDELFGAAKKVHEKHGNVVFDLVGFFEDDYKETVEQLDRDGIVRYHGFQPDVREYIKNSHCFVLASWHEGMANTLLEAASMGRPLITNSIHGCMEAVDDGVNGYLSKPHDSHSFYDQIERFIATPYEKKCKMGSASRKKMETEFDKAAVVVKTVEKLFSSVESEV